MSEIKKMEIQFDEFMKNSGLSDDEYPWSQKGRAARGATLFFAKLGRRLAIILLLLNVLVTIFKPLISELQGLLINIYNFVLKTQGGQFLFFPSHLEKPVTSTIDVDFRMFSFKVIAVIFIFYVISLIFYLLFAIMRHLNWEVYVWRNDKEAIWLKKAYLEKKQIIKRKARIRKVVNKRENQEMSLAEEIEMSKLSAIENMQVSINSRKARGSKEIRKNYKVSFRVPFQTEAAMHFDQELKVIDTELSSLVRNKASFGKVETSIDLQYRISRASAPDKIPVKKPKEKKIQIETEAVVKPEIQGNWTFPLSLFTDRRADIEKKKKIAMEWANETGEAIDGYFATWDLRVNRAFGKEGEKNEQGYLLGSSAVSYLYKAAFNKVRINLTELEAGLNDKLGMVNASITNLRGDIEVVLPLPEEYAYLTDMRTFYEEAFGKDGTKVKDATTMAFGVTSQGDYLVGEYSAAPHGKLAGATGSGKSVAINGMATSMLSHAKPHELGLIIHDPKRVEFDRYKGLPFMIYDPVVDMINIPASFAYLSSEMKKRNEIFAYYGVPNYVSFKGLVESVKTMPELFSKYKVNSFEDYEAKLSSDTLPEELKKLQRLHVKLYFQKPEIQKEKVPPLIVCITDEFSLLQGTIDHAADGDINDLGAGARSTGIHLLIATQTPRKEDLPGKIQAHLRMSIAMLVTDELESNIAMGREGAEKLRGQGDAYIKAKFGRRDIFERIQFPFVTEDELDTIFDYLKSHYENPHGNVDYKKFAVTNLGYVYCDKNGEPNEDGEITEYVTKPRGRRRVG